MFLLQREDLRWVVERFDGDLALSVLDPLQASCWLALPKASYFPVGAKMLLQSPTPRL